MAGLPEPLSGSEPATNSPLISPLLNDYDLVVQSARHPFQSEPADNPYGLDPSRLPNGPALQADGLNRLSDFPIWVLGGAHRAGVGRGRRSCRPRACPTCATRSTAAPTPARSTSSRSETGMA